MVTIIGTGHMAHGIGTRLLAGGNSVTLLGTTREKADALAEQLRSSASSRAKVNTGASGDPISDDVVVLAVPYGAAGGLLRQYGKQLAGKIVVDITNPLNASYDALVTSAGSSGAEELARVVPEARLVKAFNTTFAGTLVAGEAGGQKLDVFVAGDDDEAKAEVSRLVSAGGLHAVDVGPLHRARQLEQLGFLGIAIQQPLGLGFASGWKLVAPQS